jgi:hypothetical protein
VSSPAHSPGVVVFVIVVALITTTLAAAVAPVASAVALDRLLS